MKFSLDPRMAVSYHTGWDSLHRQHPSLQHTFFSIVLPFSLVPLIMLLYAGATHGDRLAPASTLLEWQITAGVFFVAELVSVPLMAWLLREILAVPAKRYSDCFVLAAYAAVPLWLSSLGLLSSSLLVVAMAALIGLALAFSTLFHGLPVLFDRDEDIDAQYPAYLVIAAGLFGWVLLIALAAAMLGLLG